MHMSASPSPAPATNHPGTRRHAREWYTGCGFSQMNCKAKSYSLSLMKVLERQYSKGSQHRVFTPKFRALGHTAESLSVTKLLLMLIKSGQQIFP